MEISLEQYNKMAERLTELEYMVAQMRWIPVTERLPEEAFGCIVTVRWEDPYSIVHYRVYEDTVGWDGDEWNNYDGLTLPYEVVAWMPLPEPYNGVNK